MKFFLIFFKLITGSQIFIEEKLINSFRDSHTVFQDEKDNKVLFHPDHPNHQTSLKFSYDDKLSFEKVFNDVSDQKGSL